MCHPLPFYLFEKSESQYKKKKSQKSDVKGIKECMSYKAFYNKRCSFENLLYELYEFLEHRKLVLIQFCECKTDR